MTIDIEVHVGLWSQSFMLLNPDDAKEVGKVVSAVTTFLLKKISEEKMQSKRIVSEEVKQQ